LSTYTLYILLRHIIEFEIGKYILLRVSKALTVDNAASLQSLEKKKGRKMAFPGMPGFQASKKLQSRRPQGLIFFKLFFLAYLSVRISRIYIEPKSLL